MTKTEMKKKAQDLIVEYMAAIGYCAEYDDFCEDVGDHEIAEAVVKSQMDRVAKMFGYKEAWFS